MCGDFRECPFIDFTSKKDSMLNHLNFFMWYGFLHLINEQTFTVAFLQKCWSELSVPVLLFEASIAAFSFAC